MEWFLILGLIGTTAWLWRRIDQLAGALDKVERALDLAMVRVADLQNRLVAAQEHPTEPFVAPAPTIPDDEAQEQPVHTVVLHEASMSASVSMVEPASAAQPIPALAPSEEEIVAEAPRRAFEIDFEDVFGRRLPIWAGGVTLAVAGVFLVRYSIEHGLITPLLRVIMAFVFGGALLAGAEAAYRLRERVADPRVAQALAGAGLATLYAGFYLAGTQYGLIGQTLAFLGLAAVTAGALALSFRFGLPSAVLGLVGGFAAPALVGGEDANLPLLALYLGLVTAGLTYAGREQKREWLGIAAQVGGLGWGAVMLLAGDPGITEVLALGCYFVVLGTALPALAGEHRFALPLRLGASLVTSIQLALLVDQAGYGLLAWAFYLLLGAALAVFGWRRPEFREGHGIAALVGVLLLALWEDSHWSEFLPVAAGLAAVFAGPPLAQLRSERARLVDLALVAGLAPALALVAHYRFGDFAADPFQPWLALGFTALAAIPALGAWVLWPRSEERWLAAMTASVATLIFAALLLVTPSWLAPPVALAVFAGGFALLRGRASLPITLLLRIGAAVAVCALFGDLVFSAELERLFGDPAPALGWRSLVRWLSPLAALAAMAWHDPARDARRAFEVGAAAFAYGALAQVLPVTMLAWAAAALAIALAYALPSRLSVRITLAAIAMLWAVGPLLTWLGNGTASLFGEPMLALDLPFPREALLYLVPSAAALALLRVPAWSWRGRSWRSEWLAALPLAVALHIAFKQFFAISGFEEFERLGMAERTLWEGLLLGAGWLALRHLPRLGEVLVGAALAHFILYTGLLHNPLWALQAVGPLPLANLVLPAYAVAIAAALLLRPRFPAHVRPWTDGLVAALASFAALTLLRQAFAGNVLTAVPMSQTEDLLRSLLGILLAIGFLILGSRRGERSWRVASLVLMVVAVAKVFIVDAAGLEGLLRIASFMALGFSLIGIGWLYTRQLRAAPAAGA